MKTVFSFILDNIELLAAVCGGIIALLQWRDSNNNKRAEYLDSLLNKLWENKEIQDFLLLNDYDLNWYNEAFHRSEDKTISINADKTLSFLNYICYIVRTKIIRKKERSLFDYYISAMALSQDMRCYLFDLYQYSVLNKKPFLFNDFVNLCIKQGLLPKALKDKDYYKHIMLQESARNTMGSYTLPQEITELQSQIDTQNLYLRTCSRCNYCKKFHNSRCQPSQEKRAKNWLPLNQNNPCADFEFDELYWDKN